MAKPVSLLKDLVFLNALAIISLSASVSCAVTPSTSIPTPIAQDLKSNPQVEAASPSSVAAEPAKKTKTAMVRDHDRHRDPKLGRTPPYVADKVVAASNSDIANLKKLNDRYRTAKSVSMDVSKHVKLGLIGSERKSDGKLLLSKGQLRMELSGSEKTLLVVNKKNLFAVTYPDPTLKGAAVQVIKGETTSKKAQSQALTGLLGAGGFLKSFKPTALEVSKDGETTFFLQPANDQSEFTRAQLRVSKDGKEIRELHYWDSRDNETTLSFSNTVFGAKIDPKSFNYAPPADADVMNL